MSTLKLSDIKAKSSIRFNISALGQEEKEPTAICRNTFCVRDISDYISESEESRIEIPNVTLIIEMVEEKKG